MVKIYIKSDEDLKKMKEIVRENEEENMFELQFEGIDETIILETKKKKGNFVPIHTNYSIRPPRAPTPYPKMIEYKDNKEYGVYFIASQLWESYKKVRQDEEHFSDKKNWLIPAKKMINMR